MTTPARNTPNAIIADAMFNAGKLQEGDVPNSEQLARYLGQLSDMIAIRVTQGVGLCLMDDHSVTLVSGTQTYTLTVSSVKPTRVIQGYYLDSASTRRPIYPLSWDEWMRLSNITQTGQISQYFINKQAATLTVSFWLIPDATAATGTAHLLTQRQITQPISLTETMEFTPESRLALMWGLADELCTGQPAPLMARCASKASAYWAALENWEVEDAETKFEPDSRAGSASSFQ